jgi:hypothetical protein
VPGGDPAEVFAASVATGALVSPDAAPDAMEVADPVPVPTPGSAVVDTVVIGEVVVAAVAVVELLLVPIGAFDPAGTPRAVSLSNASVSLLNTNTPAAMSATTAVTRAKIRLARAIDICLPAMPSTSLSGA